MAEVKDILSLMRSSDKKDVTLIKEAYKFAEQAHRGQERYSGEPYFNHVFETAKTLTELQMSATTIAAGLLHDTIEDVGVQPAEIEKKFGSKILFLVEGVTKLGQLKYRGLDRHNESLRKLMVAMSEDIRVLIIRLADRLHNLKTLEFVPETKQHRIAMETLEIYVPIAYRLGIERLSRELEDLCFPYIYPKEYEEISSLVKQARKKSIESVEKFRKSVWKALVKNKVEVKTVDYRVKNLYSIYQKYLRKDKDINKIYDIIALRIIVPSVSECYNVLGILHNIWQPIPGRIKDYIATPKPTNGYRSLHTTLFIGDGSTVEVQIKTQEMHQEAEYGIASHLAYKEGKSWGKSAAAYGLNWVRYLLPYKSIADKQLDTSGSSSDDLEDVPRWVKELVEYQSQLNTGRLDFVRNLKADFFQRRIFVFTPKGDVIDLPAGAGPIDFAYAVHSDVGHRVFGVTVNGKFVSLNTPLKNGDIVKIITKNTSQPSEKWLSYTTTSLAHRKIRSALNSQEKQTKRKRLSKEKKRS